MTIAATVVVVASGQYL